ncbi:hypothetical protein [Pedobacter foliorum]|uniref:hypothetical protein n=1 Tax=Pedobacter foliorum TaxID=2739058 RepID=UPI001566DB58|nr:hypothetical protein [Pedobacter foliorum]NRF39331.1 hypothetical protein [Pedobacter foliorum]
MKNLRFLMPLVAVLLVSSCKKKDTVAAPEPPEEIKKSPFLPDSTSFTINGKRYTNALITPGTSRGYGNSGVNLQFGNTNGEWSIGSGDGYWVGEVDSVQYSSISKTKLEHDEGAITVSFIKKYKKVNISKLGSMYYPKVGDNFFTLGDYPYAVDYERTGKDEGVAINLFLNSHTLTSYSQLSISTPSQLTAKSHSNSKFKILKIEEIKGTDFIILEAAFEATLFDKNENGVKVTDGFFRITTPKHGERLDSFTLLYLYL